MSFPDWADEQLSKDLSVLRDRGEGQQLEYMEGFPQNTKELAKEVAAFATSNQGTILIGVSDDGELVGLEEMGNSIARDRLLQRLEGICHGTVKPSITPSVRFAVESGKVVLILLVPKGGQPVYYSANVPYVRHVTSSRPAEPHEVMELISTYLKMAKPEANEQGSNESREFYSGLARILINILIYSDEASNREINPWLDMWRAEFGNAAAELRDLAAQEIATADGVRISLNQLSEALDQVESLRLYMGCGDELHQLTVQAANQAKALKAEWIDKFSLGQESFDEIKEIVTVTDRKLQDIVLRATDMMNSGRADELQSEVSSLGQVILQISYYNIQALGDHLPQELREIGRDLHLVETMRLLKDGGQSIIEKITSCSNRLKSVRQKFQET